MAAFAFAAESLTPLPALSPLVRVEQENDVAAREALLDLAMGPGRRRKSSESIRRGRLPADGLSLVAFDAAGAMTGTVRLWHVAAGIAHGRPVPALLLGPLAVRPDLKGEGIGSALMRNVLAQACAAGHKAVLLVGDAPYYERFGFTAEAAAGLAMPGPFERHRLLGFSLVPGTLDGARGLILPTGQSGEQRNRAANAAQQA